MSTWMSTSTPVTEPVSLSMKAAVLRSATPDLRRSLARRVSLRSLLGLAAMLTVATVQAAAFKASVISRDDDPRLERSRTERAYLGHPGGPVVDAVQVAIKEAKFELDAAGASVVVDQLAVASLDAAKVAAIKAEKAGAAALIVDLPADWLLAVTDAVKLPVFNVGDASDRLREKDCRARLYHLLPSERMRADAVAQTLLARKWSQVLLLAGSGPGDAERVAVAAAAIKRYGLKLVASKPWKLSGDPRERDMANTLLLTGAATVGSYDVVWVVDSDGEFARTVPYRTGLPRPVVGDAGMVALAWHASFERYGSPQVSKRFARDAKRPMTAQDWSAWLAGKALTAAATAQPKGPIAAYQQALLGSELDGSKGTPMTLRPWDGQLRQPLLLTDGQGVLSQAPVEGVMHPRDALDTLGADAPEKLCKARP
jgi:ABC transporter substrate binding protein (PQQ-dependent alcohol dehydrogenase system)